MSNKIELSTIFIELDTLLDTRIGTLSLYGEDIIRKNVENGYFVRKEDVFLGVNMDNYRERYYNRDKEVLKNSPVTSICFLIKEFVNKTILLSTSSPFKYKPKVTLNIHPYKLLEKEESIFMEALIRLTDKKADIEIVNLPYAEITPRLVKDHYGIMVMYYYAEWLNIQAVTNGFEKTICPDHDMIGPKIYFENRDKETKLSPTDMDPFDAICEISKPLINLQLMHIKEFSYLLGSRGQL